MLALKDKSRLIYHVILHLLCGLVIASIASLLIYFKQKPLLHHFVILLAVSSIYFGFYSIRSKIIKINPPTIIASLLILISIAWLAPQFLFQIRPYTFYISGLAIGLSVLTVIFGQFLSVTHQLSPWSQLIMVLGYLSGIWIPINVLQFVIAGFLLIYLITYLIINHTGYATSISIILVFIICTQLYFQFSKPITLFPPMEDMCAKHPSRILRTELGSLFIPPKKSFPNTSPSPNKRPVPGYFGS